MQGPKALGLCGLLGISLVHAVVVRSPDLKDIAPWSKQVFCDEIYPSKNE